MRFEWDGEKAAGNVKKHMSRPTKLSPCSMILWPRPSEIPTIPTRRVG